MAQTWAQTFKKKKTFMADLPKEPHFRSTPPAPIYSYNPLYYVYIILGFYLCTYTMILFNWIDDFFL